MKRNWDLRPFFRNLSLALMLLLFSAGGLMAQTTVTGTISDATGETLAGVNIVQKGTTNGTITDFEGKYSINVPGPESILEFTYIGYGTQEVIVGQRTIIDIVMEESAQDLEELVVIAYGKQKKSHLTGAVSSLKTEGLDEIPVSRVDQALQGQLAGVQVLNLDPEAGAAPTIRVRGMGSISAAAEPLVVVDGYPMPDGLEMVNMGDVESIEVLKDAASAAMYGSRAAGGVIIVTTKSGAENKTNYSFKMYTGLSRPLMLPDMMKTEEYTEHLYQESLLRMQDPAIDGDPTSTMSFFDITNPEKIAYLISKYVVDEPTNWLDEAMRDFGSNSSYMLSATGGDSKMRYYLSAGYSSEDAIMKKSTYNKFTLRSKVDYKLGDRVTVGLNLTPTFTYRERPRNNLTDYIRFPAWMPIRHNEATAALTNRVAGEYAQVSDFSARTYSGMGVDGEVWNMVAQNPWTSGNQNPVSILERSERKYQTYRMNLNTYINIDIAEGLSFRTSNGAYMQYREYNFKQQTEAYKAGYPNSLTRQMNFNTDLLSENILSYVKTIGDHDLNAVAGVTIQRSDFKYNQMLGTLFADEDRFSFNLAESISQTGVTSNYLYDVRLSFLGMKAAAPKMSEGGSIVNFSSQAARDGGGPGASVYAASKAVVTTFTRGMAKELGPQNIRVNAVCPGMISTSFHDRFTKDQVRTNVAAGTPLRREGEATEVADLVSYLLSDESTFVTGTNIDINGGLFFS